LLESEDPGLSGREKFDIIVGTARPYFGSKDIGSGIANAGDALEALTSGELPPTADFTAQPLTGIAPLEVQFTDLSSPEVTEYQWDFGDGSSSNLQHPSHTYLYPGNYSVTLTVTGARGTGVRTHQSFIRVNNTSGNHLVDGVIPNEYGLAQNYPNPFNPATEILFDLPEPAFVSLEVFNVAGRKVGTVVESELGGGRYRFVWNGSGFASGVYLYRLRAGEFSATRKMVLIK